MLCLLDQVSYTQSNFPRLNKSVGCDIIVISKYLCAQLDLRANIMMYRLKRHQWQSLGCWGLKWQRCPTRIGDGEVMTWQQSVGCANIL